jgi:hypothetical protein
MVSYPFFYFSALLFYPLWWLAQPLSRVLWNKTRSSSSATAKALEEIAHRMQYPVLFRRRAYYWMGITRLEFVVIILLLAANVAAIVWPVEDILTVERRLAMLAAINAVSVFLGGRTNPPTDLVGIPLSTYYLFHHWIGRVTIIEGLLHASFALHRLRSIQRTPLVRDVEISGYIVSLFFPFIIF